MKNSHQFTRAAARAATAAALLAAVAFAPGVVFAAKAAGEQRVEARITDMHAKLKITQTQEDQWAKVAEVMRDNAKSMDALTQGRFERAKNMTAVDDLKSYEQIAEAHADGIKKLTPVFATLYDGMSDAQKKEADSLFRHGGRKMSKTN